MVFVRLMTKSSRNPDLFPNFFQTLADLSSFFETPVAVVKPEALTVLREYEILWKRQEIDLSKLAKLRWAKKMTIEQIANELCIGKTTVRFHLKRLTKMR
jgi:DNA-binding CsgD family transcriptional regulator